MSEYLTIKEVCVLTGKSDKTIRNNFTSKKEELNKTTSKKVITRKGREYLILKSFVVDYYNIETGKLLVSELVTSSNETGKKPPLTGKKLVTSSNETGNLLVSLRNQLKESKEDIAYLKKKLDEEGEKTENLIHQNDQSQKLIGQLQLTNKTLLLGEREEVTNIKADEIKKDSWVWTIIALLIIIAAACGVYYMFYQIG